MDVTLAEVEHSISQLWLAEATEQDVFAKQDTAEKISKRYRMRIGNRPFARSMRAFYEANNRKLPAEFAALPGEVYAVTHALGIVADAHPGRIATLGFQATFQGDGATVDLCPNTRFREWFGADLTFRAAITADGHAAVPDFVGDLADSVIPLGAHAEVQLGASAKAVGQLRVGVKTPKVQAVGQASTTVEWQLDKDANPLVGDQILVQTVVVPRETETITYEMTAFALINRYAVGWPVRLDSAPIKAEVTLAPP